MQKTIATFCALFILFILLQSAACTNVKELDYKGIQSAQMETISLNTAAVRLNLLYHNPNDFGLDVKETNLSVYLNDQFVSIADQPEKTAIPKSADFTFPVVAHFNPLKVVGPALSSLFSKTVKLTLQGSAKIGKKGVYVQVPVNITETINLYQN